MGEGWAERAQTCPYFVSLLSSFLNKICIPFLGEGQPCSPPNTALNVADSVPPKPSSAGQLNPGQRQRGREREIVPLA